MSIFVVVLVVFCRYWFHCYILFSSYAVLMFMLALLSQNAARCDGHDTFITHHLPHVLICYSRVTWRYQYTAKWGYVVLNRMNIAIGQVLQTLLRTHHTQIYIYIYIYIRCIIYLVVDKP